jgi:hypothetical protein
LRAQHFCSLLRASRDIFILSDNALIFPPIAAQGVAVPANDHPRRQGFVADAADVGGNNIPLGGGSYVDTATTVAAATSPNGLAAGTIPVTAHPDIANGTGSGGSGQTGGLGHNGGTGSPVDPGNDGTVQYHHFAHFWHG